MTEFEFIESEKAAYPIRVLCRTLDSSKSGYYVLPRRLPDGLGRSLDDGHRECWREAPRKTMAIT